MPAFKGNLNDNSVNFAKYISEDQALANAGLGSYGAKSLAHLLSEASSKETLAKAVADTCAIEGDGDLEDIANNMSEALLGDVAQAQQATQGPDGNFGSATTSYGTYYKFDDASNKYVLTDVPIKLSELTKFWNKAQRKPSHLETDDQKKNIIQEVRNSLDGCITFEPEVKGKTKTVKKTRLYFQDKKRANDAREMVINGDPKISTVPRRATGGKYDLTRTEKLQQEGIGDSGDDNNQFGHIGRFSHSVSNKEINDQQVASKLRLSYNKAMGYFESGSQQIIARLMDDLGAAAITDIDMSESALDSYKFSDMYNSNGGEAYFSAFSTCLALPLSVHNGNPYTFGPNVIGKKSEYKKEKIRVVNRSTASFKQGEVVMCSLIDNEWIVSAFGTPGEMAPVEFKPGKWSFIKMIANSDCYFQDQRKFEDEPNSEQSRTRTIRDGEFADNARSQFYYFLNKSHSTDDLLTLGGLNDILGIAKMNCVPIYTVDELNADPNLVNKQELVNPAMIPSRRYAQSSSFDQLGTSIGGNNPHGNIIGRTNRNVNPDKTLSFEGKEIAEYNTEIPLFWGPVFTEGYSTASVRRLLADVQETVSSGLPNFVTAGTLDVKGGTNLLAEPKTHMFADNKDFSFLQVPADVATNAGVDGTNGYPIESISKLAQQERGAVGPEGVDFVKAYSRFLKDEQRLTYLSDSTGRSIFDLAPQSPGKIDFIPLSFGMAGNGDKASQNGSSMNTYDMARSFIDDSLEEGVEHFWGSMFDRERTLTDNEFTDNIYPYDTYLKHESPGLWAAVTEWEQNGDGAGMVGIIAARNTFALSRVGTVTFTTNFTIGIGQNCTSTRSQAPQFFGVGGAFGNVGFTGGSQGQTNCFQWWGTYGTQPHNFGHNSLYVKMYDHWPEEYTIYDARYFSPLHFVPAPMFSAVETKEVVQQIPLLPKSVDQETYDCDFRVPTYGGDNDNQIVPVSTIVNSETELRVSTEYRVNPICRGMMLSKDSGFKFFKRTIAVSEQGAFAIQPGENYAVDEEFTLDSRKSIKIKVKAVDVGGGITEFTITDNGKDVTIADLDSSVTVGETTVTGYALSVPSDVNSLGNGAKIVFPNGVVYDRVEETSYPKQHGSRQNLTPTIQYDTKGQLVDNKVSNITISEPSEDGKYDCFYYHVNDVTNVDMFSKYTQNGPYSFLQGADSSNRTHNVPGSNGALNFISLDVNTS